ncbi:hypothetical protein P4O66_014291 [Electrophorus voltai]|uniref:Uncharacterized protein n=1 Tax=Electrophorus voltai TaxID=2609070 RepID=A0AAD8Z2L3_9TELE|nr:hypothetical protein P4O66_014291 [Electrophorus voltai]
MRRAEEQVPLAHSHQQLNGGAAPRERRKSGPRKPAPLSGRQADTEVPPAKALEPRKIHTKSRKTTEARYSSLHQSAPTAEPRCGGEKETRLFIASALRDLHSNLEQQVSNSQQQAATAKVRRDVSMLVFQHDLIQQKLNKIDPGWSPSHFSGGQVGTRCSGGADGSSTSATHVSMGRACRVCSASARSHLCSSSGVYNWSGEKISTLRSAPSRKIGTQQKDLHVQRGEDHPLPSITIIISSRDRDTEQTDKMKWTPEGKLKLISDGDDEQLVKIMLDVPPAGHKPALGFGKEFFRLREESVKENVGNSLPICGQERDVPVVYTLRLSTLLIKDDNKGICGYHLFIPDLHDEDMYVLKEFSPFRILAGIPSRLPVFVDAPGPFRVIVQKSAYIPGSEMNVSVCLTDEIPLDIITSSATSLRRDLSDPQPLQRDPLSRDLSDPKPLQHDLCSATSLGHDLCSATSLGHEHCGPRPLQRDLSGPRPLQRDLSGPRPLQRDLSGPRPLQRDLSGPRPLQRDLSGPRPLLALSQVAYLDWKRPLIHMHNDQTHLPLRVTS